MKQLFITIFLTFAYFLQAQYIYEMEQGVPITSSDAISTNPSTLILNNEEVLMFYEKKISSTDKSEIWLKDISNMTEASLLFSNESIDFYSPRPIHLIENEQSSLYLLFFTTFDGTQYTIKYVEWDENLIFGEPQTLTTCPNNPMIRITYKGNIVWVNGESLFASKVNLEEGIINFDEFQIIDNGIFSDIKILTNANHTNLYYIKSGNVDHLFKQIRYYSGWDSPIELDSGIITNLSTCNMEEPYPMEYSFAVWNNGDIAYANDYYDEVIPQYFTQNSTVIDSTINHVTAFPYYIPLKEKDFPDYFMVMVSDYTGQDDVYLTENMYAENQSLSNDPYSHGNISLHTGLSGWGYWPYTYCEIIWETYIEGKTVLYHTHFQWDFASGINENSNQNAFKLQLTPNPISTQANISFTVDNNSDIQLFVYSINGEKIYSKTISNIEFGKNTVKINQLQKLKSGIYFLKLAQGDNKQIKKFIVK